MPPFSFLNLGKVIYKKIEKVVLISIFISIKLLFIVKNSISLYVVLVCVIFSSCGKNADLSQAQRKSSVTSEQPDTLGFRTDGVKRKIKKQPFYPMEFFCLIGIRKRQKMKLYIT